MGTDPVLLREQCERTLLGTDLSELGRLESGKVRDSYVTADKRRYIVVSDRVSCFDVVVGTLPFKGQVLNQIAAFWFGHTREIAPNHLIEVPDPNVSLVREYATLPVEFVMRGYLTGSSPTSIWTAYSKGERVYCGHTLPDGMTQHEPLRTPLLTPTTKAPKGSHDELISREELIASGDISEELYDAGAKICSALFGRQRGRDRRDPYARLVALLVSRSLRARALRGQEPRGAGQGVRAALADRSGLAR
jgi:phosphoribosylaminoimidazole-succinocarboxamide synthase